MKDVHLDGGMEPIHSMCWKQAVEGLLEGCKGMDGTMRPLVPVVT